MGDLSIDGIYIVDDVKYSGSFCVTLPIGDEATVGAPTETISTGELLLLDPVESTIHETLAPIRGQWPDFSAGYLFHIDVILADISHSRAIR